MWWIGKVKERVKIIAIAVVFNIVTNLIFIHLIWVYGAALATWIGWILIWVLSETYLWKTYRIQINYRSIYTNIFFMFILWIWSYIYVVPLFNDITRWPSFFYMSLISILWFGIFILINRKEFKILIQEIQRIRKIKPHH
jgi:O-antigen/teichoic acid export membrane protein